MAPTVGVKDFLDFSLFDAKQAVFDLRALRGLLHTDSDATDALARDPVRPQSASAGESKRITGGINQRDGRPPQICRPMVFDEIARLPPAHFFPIRHVVFEPGSHQVYVGFIGEFCPPRFGRLPSFRPFSGSLAGSRGGTRFADALALAP